LLFATVVALEAPLRSGSRGELDHLAATFVCTTVRRWGKEQRVLTAGLIEALYRLRDCVGSGEVLPIAATWIELHPGSLDEVELDLACLARIDEWLSVAQTMARYDLAQLARFHFESERATLGRLADMLAAHKLEGDGTLVDSVLSRIADLFPDLAAGAAAAAQVDSRRRAMSGGRWWWAPEDIVAPPNYELAAEARDFEHGDVHRVLKDL
jgi:hypothetical protein